MRGAKLYKPGCDGRRQQTFTSSNITELASEHLHGEDCCVDRQNLLEELVMQLRNHVQTTQSLVYRKSTVFVVDSDSQIQRVLGAVLSDIDLDVVACSDASALLEALDHTEHGIVILSASLPDATGLEVQRKLAEMDSELPIVFISDECDVLLSVEAMKAGAVDFLLKPLDRYAIIRAVHAAISKGDAARELSVRRRRAHNRAAKLTRREREVFEAVTRGLMNKQIAFEMGISEIMVKIHRGKMMKKMEARSVVDLVRSFELLKIVSIPSHYEMPAWSSNRGMPLHA